jgi:hypothetical protein
MCTINKECKCSIVPMQNVQHSTVLSAHILNLHRTWSMHTQHTVHSMYSKVYNTMHRICVQCTEFAHTVQVHRTEFAHTAHGSSTLSRVCAHSTYFTYTAHTLRTQHTVNICIRSALIAVMPRPQEGKVRGTFLCDLNCTNVRPGRTLLPPRLESSPSWSCRGVGCSPPRGHFWRHLLKEHHSYYIVVKISQKPVTNDWQNYCQKYQFVAKIVTIYSYWYLPIFVNVVENLSRYLKNQNNFVLSEPKIWYIILKKKLKIIKPYVAQIYPIKAVCIVHHGKCLPRIIIHFSYKA